MSNRFPPHTVVLILKRKVNINRLRHDRQLMVETNEVHPCSSVPLPHSSELTLLHTNTVRRLPQQQFSESRDWAAFDHRLTSVKS